MRAITHLKVCQSSHMAYLSTVRASFETLVERKCSKCVQIPKKKKKNRTQNCTFAIRKCTIASCEYVL